MNDEPDVFMGDFEMYTVGSISKGRMGKFHSPNLSFAFRGMFAALRPQLSEIRKSSQLVEKQEALCPGLKVDFSAILAMWYFIGRCSSNMEAEVLPWTPISE